ncbi:ZIP family metal transporter [Virgibacillus ndiopensis]|uniref:ZIP family metal transporter n=1 Tax=Virgibacillus ndiopensis TaxID=2004408 RepID=UPI000C076544|nr:ZIP family metal transporter [Virgibacillus ndiopensis]
MDVGWLIGVFASGIGVGVGGGLAWIMKGIRENFAFIYSLSSGLIMGLLVFEMIPESVALGGWGILVIGMMAGVLIFYLIHYGLDRITIITGSQQKDIFIRAGLLLAVSIALHNFPVGMALGSTIGTDVGNALLATLVLHNIPEGIIIFTPLFLAGFGFFTWVLLTVLITLPIAVGGMVGQYVGVFVPSLLAFIVNLAIAIIFMIAVKEIFVVAVKNSSIVYSTAIGTVGFGSIYLYMTI